MNYHVRFRICLIVPALLLLTSCAIKTEPFTAEQLVESAEHDLSAMFSGGEPLTAPLTEADVIARVLKYNLDSRAKVMEEALALNQSKIDRWDLLPQLTANAGYNYRSEYNATSSRYLYGQTGAFDRPSYSSDRDQVTADIELSWNVLDFGVSYFNARQNADRSLIAAERKRKAVHSLVQEVRFVFWRGVAHQTLRDEVTQAISEAREALAIARTVEEENLKSPGEALGYQKKLLETLHQLSIIQQELSTAEIELAALINVPPGTPIKLAVPDELNVPAWNVGIEQMEYLAFVNNADLREEEYKARISVNETRKAIARLFPGITFNIGPNYDHNSFLVENSWYETGARLSWNLMNLVAGPDVLEHAKTSEELVRVKRLALRMAVLAQVHMAEQQFRTSINRYQQADELWQINDRLYEISRSKSANDAQGMLQRVADLASSINAKLRRYQAFAQVEQAFGRMQESLGQDLLPDQMANHDLSTLVAVINERLDAWGKGEITPSEGKMLLPPTESVLVGGVSNSPGEGNGSDRSLAYGPVPTPASGR